MSTRPTVAALRALESENFRLKSDKSSFASFRGIAWNGGSSPRKPSCVPVWERAFAKALFREQVKTFSHYWGDSPDWDTFRTFARRARADAHATFRDAFNR